MSIVKVLSCILLICLVSLPLSAQVSSGELVGTITDSSGAAVPNAKIIVTNAQTNTVVRETLGSNDGTYTVTLLPPGRYNVSAEAPSFRKTVQNGIELQTNQRAKVDFQLQVGQVSEVVEVNASAPLLESQSSSLGTVIGSHIIGEIPLNGRNFVHLALLTPGVNGCRIICDRYHHVRNQTRRSPSRNGDLLEREP